MKILPSPEIETQHPLLAIVATTNPDVLYFHQAKKEEYWGQFKNGMKIEMQVHIDNKIFEIIKRSVVPKTIPILTEVWVFKRKISDHKCISGNPE